MNFPRVQAAIAEHYGLDVLSMGPVKGGLDTFARAFRITAASGEYFVKVRHSINPGNGLSRALADQGIRDVIAPLRTKGGDIAVPTRGGYALVYPYVDLPNGFQQKPNALHWRLLGEALRQIHTASLSPDLQSRLNQETFVVEGIPEFQANLARVENMALAAFIAEKREVIDHCLARVQELGEMCRNRSWQLFPCHADLHVGNILLGDDAISIVDWDSPRLAPYECDLIFVDHGGITGLHSPIDEAAFFAGYGAVETSPLAMTYYRFARAVEDFVAFTRDASDPELSQEQAEHLRGFKTLFEPGQIVETAMWSDSQP